MMTALRNDADYIIKKALKEVLPDAAVKKALQDFQRPAGRLILLAAGKAAPQMASAALEVLGSVDEGLVITKYGHSRGEIPGCRILESAHPVPDDNSFAAGRAALELVRGCSAEDCVICLISGGGSSLMEWPLIPGEELSGLTSDLLACGADITEINTVRKCMSAVKGGKLGQACAPARVFNILLSDVLGDRADIIAGGPTVPDASEPGEAAAVIEKYHIAISPAAQACLQQLPVSELPHVTTTVGGSVRQLVQAAEKACRELGYDTLVLNDSMCSEARDAGRELGGLLRLYQGIGKPVAFLAGGETVVHITGTGLGGRNQELALAAAEGISGLNAAVFSLGSDGTDGPTDAAGGYTDGDSLAEMQARGIDPAAVLQNNDSYHALKAIGGLLMTGPTGTNVNDVSVGLGKFGK